MKTITLRSHLRNTPNLTINLDDAKAILQAHQNFLSERAVDSASISSTTEITLGARYTVFSNERAVVDGRGGFSIIGKQDRGFSFKSGIALLEMGVIAATANTGTNVRQVAIAKELDDAMVIKQSTYKEWDKYKSPKVAWINEKGDIFVSSFRNCEGEFIFVADTEFYPCRVHIEKNELGSFVGRKVSEAEYRAMIMEAERAKYPQLPEPSTTPITPVVLLQPDLEDVFEKVAVGNARTITLMGTLRTSNSTAIYKAIDIPVADAIALARMYNQQQYNNSDIFEASKRFNDRNHVKEYWYINQIGSIFVSGGGNKIFIQRGARLLIDALRTLADHHCETLTNTWIVPTPKHAQYFDLYPADLDKEHDDLLCGWRDESGLIVTNSDIDTVGTTTFTHAVSVDNKTYQLSFASGSNQGKLRFDAVAIERKISQMPNKACTGSETYSYGRYCSATR